MNKYKKIIILLMFAAVAVLYNERPLRGTIASVVTTPAAPTVLSNGLSYYLAGKTYNFAVQVIDPDIAGWAQLTDVRIAIPNSTAIVIFLNPSGTGTDLPVTVSSGTVDVVADVAGTYNNCTVTFKVTFRWDTPESGFTAARNVIGSATTSFPAVNTVTNTAVVSYGVCAGITVLNFSSSGAAADGMINPWHDAFNISGTIVYNVPGAGLADRLETVDSGEVTGAILYIDGNATALADIDAAPDGVNFTVTQGFINTVLPVLGNHTWRVRAQMLTGGGLEASVNSLTVNCDRVEVIGITFLNGGGIDAPAYYRSVNIPGTEVRVTARMQNSFGPMSGITTVVIRNYTDTQDINVVIPNGSTSAVAFVPNPTAPPPDPGTLQKNYRAEMIVGGSYGGDSAPNGQNVNTRITQPPNPSIYWDRNDPPGSGAPFTPWAGISATSYSLTFNWTPIANAAPDQDFYTYRLHYKKTTDILYLIVDRNTAGYAALGAITANTMTITGLIPLTNYDYYITAVDVFGNETLPADYLPPAGGSPAGTIASTVRVTITDGITTYDDDTFAVITPSLRPLRKSAVRVKIFIVAAGDLPDVVNIIAADYTTLPLPGPLPPPTFIESSAINPALTENDPAGFYRFSTLKTGPNEWTGYIPESNPLMAVNTEVKFLVETIKSGVASYADHDIESEAPPGNPNNLPYTFRVDVQPQFQPWPTRILNNVIDNKNPRAYPAYYLTDDAYVTITVYDIKGRPVKTILDNAFRKGGQNIKEGGWPGDNKANKKLGVGLYYIRFEAKRASDGKIILSSTQKVVVAK